MTTLKELLKPKAEVRDTTAGLITALAEFLHDKPQPSGDDLMQTYTESPGYLLHTIANFHKQNNTIEFKRWLLDNVPQGKTVWDIGCSCGFTGLTLALKGYDVGFHDFEGLGLQFIRWFAKRENLNVTVMPYNEHLAAPPRSWAIALDVMEHTGNHLGFLKWMKELGDTVAISFPMATFKPPYVTVLDEWVDREAIRTIVHQRYEVMVDYFEDRTYLVFK